MTCVRVCVPTDGQSPLRIRDLVGESLVHEGWDSFSVAIVPSAEIADWRESDAVKQAREWLANIGSPLWPGYTEGDWANLLRLVLEERDFIGEWLQRMLDDEYKREREDASA